MTENTEFNLFPYPNRDGKTWGWRWHNTVNRRDFGPTFPTMRKARKWLNDNSATAIEQSAAGDPVNEVEDGEANELVYEQDADLPEEEFTPRPFLSEDE